MAARLSDQLADDVLAVVVAVDQLPIGLGLLDRIEIFPLNIFDQRHFGPGFLIEFPDYCWNFMKLRALRSPPAALAGDQFIAIRHRPYQDRLKDAAFGNRRGQLFQCFFIENLPRLVRIGPDPSDVDGPDAARGGGGSLGLDPRRIVDQGAEATPQPGRLLQAATASSCGKRAMISRARRT